MLKIIIAGKVGTDAELKESNGKKFVVFSVYSSYKQKDGNYHSTFVNCTYFHDKAEAVLPFLKKGKGVYVEGEPSARAYTDKSNMAQASLDCVVSRVELCGDAMSVQGAAPQQQASAPQQAKPQLPVQEDLPF